jgi:ABC-type uncharacterized transport system substrate-binding protein
MRAHVLAFVALLCISCQPTDAADRRRIYFLESLSPATPAAVLTIDAFKKRLSEKTTEQFEIFIDYMELVRLPSQAHIDRMVQYLSGKYREAPPDVLVTLGRAALPFIAKYRDAIAPQVPVILASVPSTDAQATDLPNVFLVTTEYDFPKTIELARRLQPNAHNLVVVSGASEYDRKWLDLARRGLEPYSDRYNIKYVAGLSYDETLKEVSRLKRYNCSDVVFLCGWFWSGSRVA